MLMYYWPLIVWGATLNLLEENVSAEQTEAKPIAREPAVILLE